MRVAENVLPTRKAHYWIRASACHHSLWPEGHWPTWECSSYSKYCGKKFGKVSRELLMKNKFEVFNKVERGFLGRWFMLCHLCCLLPNGALIAFLLLVPQLKPLFTFAFIFSISLNFPYLLFNYYLALFAFCKLFALKTLSFTAVAWEQENEIFLLQKKLIWLLVLFPLC